MENCVVCYNHIIILYCFTLDTLSKYQNIDITNEYVLLLTILYLTLHFLGDMIEYCLVRSHLCDACLTDMHKNILMDALLLGSYFIIIKQQQTHNYTRWWIFLSWNPISHHLPSWKSHVAKWGLEKEYRFHVIWYIMIYILIPNEHIIEYTKLSESSTLDEILYFLIRIIIKIFRPSYDTIADPTIFDNVTFSINRQFQTLV